MKLLEVTATVLSLGKLCDEHGHSYEWINGQKPHFINATQTTSSDRCVFFDKFFLKLFKIHDTKKEETCVLLKSPEEDC